MLTRDDAVRLEVLAPSISPSGELMVAAAVGISATAAAHATRLAELGVSAIVLDTAHGHQRRMLEAVAEVRQAIGPAMPLVAGNVCTAEATRALIEAGADVVKVNVGPGAMCTTRMQTGAGRPTFTSVQVCAREARRLGKHVWADGGVRYPRDIALYLAAGAARVMVGTALAGTYESPGDVKEDRDGSSTRRIRNGLGEAVADPTSESTHSILRKKGLFPGGHTTSAYTAGAGERGCWWR